MTDRNQRRLLLGCAIYILNWSRNLINSINNY